MNRIKKKTAVAFLILIGVLCIGVYFLTGAFWKKLQVYTVYTAFDTETVLQFYASDDDAEEIYEQFEEELYRYHQLFDIYHDYAHVNNIKTINDQAGIAPVEVDSAVIDVLKLGVEICEMTEGRTNIAMGSVLSLWHDYRTEGMADPENAQLPPMPALKAAAEHTDIKKVVIDEENSTVYLADDKMSLDVGAIAKGYAAARLAKKLETCGVTSGLLDVGGNVVAIGKKTDGARWRIGLQNPDLSSENTYIHVLSLDDVAVVTSGDYQRYYTVEGEKYHHIIDSETLMPSGYFTSVSVIAKDSGLADALSTALFSMDETSGRALVDKLEGIEALWVYKDGHEAMTEGFEKYLER